MTKALIRNEGETITDDCGLSFIDWKTGAPLTNSGWFGGPYILMNDYVPEDPADDFDPTPTQNPTADTIVIDGKRYNKEELRSLLE